VEGSGHSLFEVLHQYLPEGVEKTKKIITKCFERELSREPSVYEPEA